jgi:predicted 3-demethylubiquinone-9 3-methyltransferase (glyoxalase superfamily)
MSSIQKITPYLWFDSQAEEAAQFYCSIFKNSKVISSSPMIVEFEIEGLKFIGLNGGPRYKFSEATSFFVLCENQDEVDHYWGKLISNGGEEGPCGWLKDKYGLSWQIVPKRFTEMMNSGDAEKVNRVLDVMKDMKKMIIADFERVYNS